ncbi:MAG TPA: hypothetical protein VEC16_06620 [Alphaproteobacteria bacterium]|nr:hypothetical protein [Alphaproteobacteria bacterium]
MNKTFFSLTFLVLSSCIGNKEIQNTITVPKHNKTDRYFKDIERFKQVQSGNYEHLAYNILQIDSAKYEPKKIQSYRF